MAHVLAKDLRDAVLQAAFSGKLTNKCSNDAKIDLFNIIEEQKKLIDKKIIKVGKYDKTVINDFDINFPEHWTMTKMGQISSLVTKQTGFDYSKNIKPNLIESKKDNTIPLIQTRNFKGESFDFNSKYYLPTTMANQYPNLILNKPCLLLSIVGASIGNVGLFNKNEIGFLGGAIAKVDLIDDRILKYIYYYLTSPLGFFQIMKNYKSTAQGTITVEDVRNIVVPFPPIEEQARIVAKVEELMAEIDEYEKLENELVELKKNFPSDMKAAVLQAAMEGKLSKHLKSDTPINVHLINKNKNKSIDLTDLFIPDHWECGCLESFCELISTKLYQIKESEITASGQFKVVSQSRLEFIGYTDQKERLYTHNKPVVTFGDHTTIVKYIDFDFVVGADGLKIFNTNEICNPKFLYYALELKCTGLENIGGYSRHYKYIKNKAIPLPPIEEQQRIVEKLDKLLPLCDALCDA